MEPDYRYDAHCHIFTLKYALKELRNMLHDMLQRTYPWKEPTNKLMLSSDKGGVWDILKELLRQLYELIHAAGGSELENLDFLQEEAGKAFPESKLRIVPLMMDIFYMLAYPMDKDQDVIITKGIKATIEVDKDEFQTVWNEILDDFTSYLESKRLSNKLTTDISSSNDFIELALQLVEEERSVKGTLILKNNVKNGYCDSLDFYHTDGFCYHMDNLMDLVKTRNGELFPFVAIDPRRPDIIKTLLSGGFTKGDPRFYGVKLYPRMGYHPQCKPMDDVYKFCSDKNLPITFHCGKGGFPPITTPKRRDFGKPENFEPVIQKYPNLKIDFAHLGSSDKTHEWAKKIVEMIGKYDNVYSDLSCYTHKKDLDYVKENYWDKNQKLKTRLMFGTDFDVMYFTGIITMQNYYNNFKNTFTTDELKMLMHDNPMRFMNIT
jgi:predicted TIM-barrel fold metal-dependent hydrolase